jgi:hypothetical protein
MSRNTVVLILGLASLLAAVAIVGLLTEHAEIAIGIGAAVWGVVLCGAMVVMVGVFGLGRDTREEEPEPDEPDDDDSYEPYPEYDEDEHDERCCPDEPILKRNADEGPRTW